MIKKIFSGMRIEFIDKEDSGSDVATFKALIQNAQTLKWVPKRQWASERIVTLELTPSLATFIFNEDFPTKALRQIIKLVSKHELEGVTDYLIKNLQFQDAEVKSLCSKALSSRHLSERQRVEVETFILRNIAKKQKDSVYLAVDLVSNTDTSKRTLSTVWDTFRKHTVLNQTILIHNSDLFLSDSDLIEFLESQCRSMHPEIRESAVRKLVELNMFNHENLNFLKTDDDIFVATVSKGEKLGTHLVNCSISEDKARGILYGAAIGDAIGAPVEFLTKEQIIEKYKSPVDTFDAYEGDKFLRSLPGSITDDTDMGLRILEASLDAGWIDPSAIGVHFSTVVGIIDKGDMPNIGYSANTSAGLRKVERGANWRLVGRHLAQGCGAAMRAFAIPLLCDERSDNVVTYDVSRLTHKSPQTLDSALVVVKAIRWLSNLKRGDFRVDLFISFLDSLLIESEEMTCGMENFSLALRMETDAGLASIGTKGDAVETVPAALYCFSKFPNDFKSMLRLAINVTGDSDSIACIAGSLFGAYNGYSSIDKDYIDSLRDKTRIDEIITRLFDQ
jgi:ADP-ribosylglycohydrolase